MKTCARCHKDISEDEYQRYANGCEACYGKRKKESFIYLVSVGVVMLGFAGYWIADYFTKAAAGLIRTFTLLLAIFIAIFSQVILATAWRWRFTDMPRASTKTSELSWLASYLPTLIIFFICLMAFVVNS